MAVLTVGADKVFATIAAAVAAAGSGDTIAVDAGTYTNDFPGLINDLTIRGVGGMVHIVETQPLANGVAVLNVAGSTTLSNLDVSGAHTSAGDGAAVRYGGGHLLIDNSTFENNQIGLMAADDPNGVVLIQYSEFAGNGTGSTTTGNIAVGDVAKLLIQNSYIHDVKGGDEVLSRAEATYIASTRIYDNSSAAQYAINLPNGGFASITGGAIEQGSNSTGGSIIAYGEEGKLHAYKQVYLNSVTLVDDRPNAYAFWNAGAATVSTQSVTLYGVPGERVYRGTSTYQRGITFTSTRPTLDTSAPRAFTDPAAPTMTVDPSVVGITRDPILTLSGTITAPAASGISNFQVLDLVDGVFQMHFYDDATLDPDGRWHWSPYLNDGVHQFSVTATAYGGVHTSEVLGGFTVAVDTTGPTLRGTASMSGTTAATGIFLSGTITDAVSGAGGVELFDTAGGRWTDLGAATLDGGTWHMTADHLSAGSHNFVAVGTDIAGNASAVTIGLPVTVVAALPLKPMIQRIVGNMDGGLTFLGSAEPKSTVTISRTDGQFTSNVGSATANAAGTFSLVLTGLWVRSGVDAFTATSTNAAGQRGTSTGTFQLSGPGSDALSGTTGQSDVFATFLRTGQDTIVGFETARAAGAAHDVINLSGTGYGSYSVSGAATTGLTG